MTSIRVSIQMLIIALLLVFLFADNVFAGPYLDIGYVWIDEIPVETRSFGGFGMLNFGYESTSTVPIDEETADIALGYESKLGLYGELRSIGDIGDPDESIRYFKLGWKVRF